MGEAVRVLIGTSKGAFVLDSDAARQEWRVSGPHCDIWPINHVIGDPETGTLWAAGGNEWFGSGVWRSEDGGAHWSLTKFAKGQSDDWLASEPATAETLGMVPWTGPAPFTGEVTSIWSLGRGGETLYAGTNPANLYESHDGGETWQRQESLAAHPSRDTWTPGGAGLVLHTIVADPSRPERLWLGISAAGVFATEDGGASWDRRNRRSNAAAAQAAAQAAAGDLNHPAAGDTSEIGQCVHNMVHAAGADLLYQQNHHGVFRSADGGRTWEDVTEGLPSTFGFPICVHPRDPQTLWVVPLNGDTRGRYPPGGVARVWRSRDGGARWAALGQGLPGANCYFTVLRQAMATDRGEPAGVYFGTNTGSVFATADEGESWAEIARHLPTILSVETVPVA